jgi:cytochrome P450
VIAHIEVDGELAPFDLLHNILETVVSGGVSTTVSLIAHALLWLPEDPAERAALAADPERLALAMREYLRLSTPASNLARLTAVETEIGGQVIAPGERVVLCYAAANRDARAFTDPEAIRLDREEDKHLSFGIGRHRCIGMHIAMMLAETVVARALERLPDYRADCDHVERYARIPVVNGVVGLPATFTPGRPVGAVVPAEGPPLPEKVRVGAPTHDER